MTTATQTAEITPHVLHNLVGWDLLTADGWQTIREATHRHGDTLVTTDETEPGREWSFGSRKVQVRAPREAVALSCGHVGVPGTGRGADQDYGFCWFGCFATVTIQRADAEPVRPRHPHGNGGACWTHSTCEALAAVAELRLFAIRKDDHEVSVRLDQIEAALKAQQVQ